MGQYLKPQVDVIHIYCEGCLASSAQMDVTHEGFTGFTLDEE